MKGYLKAKNRFLVEVNFKIPGIITFKKRFSKIMHSIITRINMTFIVDYLHVFNIFMMNLTRNNGSEKKLQIFLT